MDLISWKRLNNCSVFLFYFPMFVFSDIKGLSFSFSVRLCSSSACGPFGPARALRRRPAFASVTTTAAHQPGPRDI